MKQKQGITRVIALLDDNELALPNTEANNEQPIDIRDVYTNAQLPFLVQPMRDVQAYRTIMEYIDAVAKEEGGGGKVVVHCTGGVGRAGRVASGWLVYR
jgi:protein-tyrosine phosphatase